MKPLDDLDHYEILEVPPGAAYEDIERAYQMTRAAYTEGSMALYSIYSNNDAKVIRGRIDEAYRVLADPEVRAQYDVESGIAATPSQNAPGQAGASSAGRDLAQPSGGRSGQAPELSSAIEVFDDIDAEIDEEQQEFDGAALRRARLRRGVELDQISEVTKVGLSNLNFIEEEAFDQLPASVYIRGFVNAYARAIGLDANRVASTYMARVDAARNPPKHSLRSSS